MYKTGMDTRVMLRYKPDELCIAFVRYFFRKDE